MLSKRISEIHGRLATRQSEAIGRDEYLDFMTFQANERPLFTELFGPLLGVKDEWRGQGATESEIDLSAFRYRRPGVRTLPVSAGIIDPVPEEILSEDDELLIGRDGYGRTVRLSKAAATLALPVDYPVKTMDDWRAFKYRYAYSPVRLESNWESRARESIAEGCIVNLSLLGVFDEPRNLMGEEALCVAYYEDPELVHDMVQTITDLAVRLLEEVTTRIVVDQVSIHEDMAGGSGPLAGPRQVREYIAPYYRALRERLDSRGGRLLAQDSDGDITSILGLLVDAGLNVTWPCQPVGDMDMVALRKHYGRRLAFAGGIDKFCLLRGREAIDGELEAKIPPLLASGGCFLGLDHRIPNGVTIDAYRYYVTKVWEIMEG